MGRVRFGAGQNRSQVVARSARTSGLANGAAGYCSSYGSADSYGARGARGARQRSGGVEKYSSIASRQAPEHGSTASSLGPGSRISAAIFSAQLSRPRRGASRSPCSYNSTCEMSVRGSRSSRLHAGSGAVNPLTPRNSHQRASPRAVRPYSGRQLLANAAIAASRALASTHCARAFRMSDLRMP